MPYSVRRTFPSKRPPRAQLQWTEARAARDAVAADARRAPLVLRSNVVLNQGEFKSVDVTADLACDTSAQVRLLNGIARGDEINERVGREVTLRSIQFNYTPHVTSVTGGDQQHRVLLVYDRQTNATALTAAQVLLTADTIAPRNLENRKRFKILFDRTVALNASGEPGSSVTRRFYRKLRHPVSFNAGDAGTVADIVTGSLYLIVIGTTAPGVAAGAVFFAARIRYTDN